MTPEQHKKFRDRIDNPHTCRKIGTYVHKFHIRMNALNTLNKVERKFSMNLCLIETKKSIFMNFDSVSSYYLDNLISAIYRNKLKLI